MRQIGNDLHADPQFEKLLGAVRGGIKSIYLHGLVKESVGHFLFSVSESLERPVFVVSENIRRSGELVDEIKRLCESGAELYPEEELNFFSADSVIARAKEQRLRVMSKLSQGKPIVVATTLSAIKRRVTPPKLFQRDTLRLSVGMEIAQEELIDCLHDMMYERVPNVEHRGQFSVRGGIIDCFSMVEEQPFRIELFDTEIDSIRSFDISTQRSSMNQTQCRVEPAQELKLLPSDLDEVLDGVQSDLDFHKRHESYGRDDLHATEKFQRMMAQMREQGRIANEDLFSVYLRKKRQASLLDYLPEDALVVFEDYNRIFDRESGREKLWNEELANYLDRGEILHTHLKSTFPNAELIARLRAHSVLNLTQILKQSHALSPELLLQMRSIEAERFDRRWDDFCKTLRERMKQNYRILFFAGDALHAMAARLEDAGIPIGLEESGAEPEIGRVVLSGKSYAQGFRYPDIRFWVITQTEITGREKRKTIKSAPKSSRDFIQYQDFAVGDYVVHETYGIGQYAGLRSMDVQGNTRDFLCIEYRGKDTLYIPTEEMNLIGKYIGQEGKAPHLSTLGGGDWQKAKSRVKKAVDQIAEDLVELYAKRAKVQGYSFSPDTPWQAEFEEAFPYEETASQLRAAKEIKADMESTRPMDRLLCGDVGYGKTEVALRAAFKAIMDGKQVAFLCPTTILTQQHYSTMVDRFEKFAIHTEFLSRFKTPQQQKAVLDGLKKGSVDIVVGTHRLLSKDIQFANLGLLIIDEEQRFGVKDKEKIKKWKENLDVLTLSATPIPRTLQLSLTGIRDMSLLEEPPEERYPTTTYVMEYDAGVVRDAIQRELDRSGQVYFVYNRVYDIDHMAARLQEQVPGAAIEIAHGKMTTRQLENVMERFVEGEIDILLSTTIIETGMDIPNVNTLIVYNADRMGLSQLYQLKGRIGRSDRMSFAYFTYEPNKVISEISEKRLKAIKDFSEFGSGYKIAMRDLELRGAGNLLGESQSGHVESIGYELYVRMLEDAVSRIKGLNKREMQREIRVDIKTDAFISEDYIAHTVDKIMMYRKIASVDSEAAYDAMVEELIDRYGDIPKSVLNILDVVLIKHWATELGFDQVREIDGAIELRYDTFERFSVEMLEKIAHGYQGPLTFDFQKVPTFKVQSTANKLKDVLRLLKWMKQLQETENKEEV